MRFVEYGYMKNDKFYSGLGDRSIVILDKRNFIQTSINDANKFNGINRPIYTHCKICEGEAFTRSKPVTGILKLENK